MLWWLYTYLCRTIMTMSQQGNLLQSLNNQLVEGFEAHLNKEGRIYYIK